MTRSLLRYFTWISLVVIAGVSCRSARVSYSGMPFSVVSSERTTFKTTLTWGEREISGFMLIKKIEDGNLKIAFYNELGMTFLEGMFDPSVKNSKLIIKNIAPVIDYKLFINNFERCLQELCKMGEVLITMGQIWDSNDKTITVELNNGFVMNATSLQ